MPEAWRLRARTLEALGALLAAPLAIAAVGIARWHHLFGLKGEAGADGLAEARRLARHVERAAGYLPMESRCLARAMALSRMLRRRRIAHRLVIAVRPAAMRGADDALHAWLEAGETIVIGDLPGPWLQLHSLPAK